MGRLTINFSWGGLSHSIRKLRKLDKKEGKKIWRKALGAGASVLLKTVRPLMPTDTKTLRKSLSLRLKERRKDKVLVAIVGPRRKFEKIIKGRKLKPSKYAHLVEGGHRVPGGRVEGKRPLGRAVQSTRGNIYAAIIAKTSKELEKL